MSKNLFYLPIGDWSSDGHRECEKITIEANCTIEELREAHFKIKEVSGVNIEEIANEYECCWIETEVLLKLMDIGLDPQDYTDVDVVKEEISKGEFSEVKYFTQPEYMGKLWIDLLNKVDETLEIKEVEDKIKSISFYGFDEKGRHIGTVGYGTLGL